MKTLVLYSSKYGTTEKCAKMIKEALPEIDLLSLDQNKHVDIKDYDSIVFGTSVYIGKIRKKVDQFINDNMAELSQKTLRFYFCCNESTDYKSLIPASVESAVNGIYHFGFELQTRKMGFLDRIITQKVAGTKEEVYKLEHTAIHQLASDLKV